MPSGPEITRLLQAASSGEERALHRVVSLLYEDLCGIAHRQLRREETGHTLDTSAVVHEAYIQLAQMEGFDWKNRSHFSGVAGMVMRRVLVQHARERSALKRGGGTRPLALSEAPLFTESQAEQLLVLDELMETIHELGPRCRQVVECRVFAGMTLNETADFLAVSPATVKRDWQITRAWLNHEMTEASAG